jgi:very-short-patch-repair endonuclease
VEELMAGRRSPPAARTPSPQPLSRTRERGSYSPPPQAGEGGPKGRERAAPKARKRVTLEKAKGLRSNQTDAELRLWYHLRAGRFLGLKFKRQHPVGPYIVDFACMTHRLIVEADGGQHNASQTDAVRDAFLKRQGFRVLRYWNDDVLRDTAAVLDSIRLAVGEAPSPTALRAVPPLPQAGEGKRI